MADPADEKGLNRGNMIISESVRDLGPREERAAPTGFFEAICQRTPANIAPASNPKLKQIADDSDEVVRAAEKAAKAACLRTSARAPPHRNPLN